MTIAQAPAEPTAYRFSRTQYDQLVDSGMLEDRNVEFIDGEILQMSPINNPHAWACSKLTSTLYRIFGLDAYIRVQSPLAIGDSEPQPDIAVIATSLQKEKNHPSTALLVVEISSSSLRFDRTDKASLYASAAIQDYWILNLHDRQLEVHRSPAPDPNQRFTHRYAHTHILKPTDTITPLVAPHSPALKIADMLP